MSGKSLGYCMKCGYWVFAMHYIPIPGDQYEGNLTDGMSHIDCEATKQWAAKHCYIEPLRNRIPRV